ncbi:MAG: hypothetical protein U5L04_13040 [Trueperaceae bacterium]|nr:hypothetical protein [Trueperaceae bacterium]
MAEKAPREGEVKVLAELLQSDWTHGYALKKRGFSIKTAKRVFVKLFDAGFSEREERVTKNNQVAVMHRLNRGGRGYATRRIREYELNHEIDILNDSG